MIIKIKGRRWRTTEEWESHVARRAVLCYVGELSPAQAEFVSSHETVTAKVKVAKRWKLVKAFPAVVHETLTVNGWNLGRQVFCLLAVDRG